MAWTSMNFPQFSFKKDREIAVVKKNTWRQKHLGFCLAPAFQTRDFLPGFPSKAPNLCALSAKSARKVDIGSMPQKTRGTSAVEVHRKNAKKTYPKILGISLVSKKVAWLDIITWAINSRTWYRYYMWLYMYLCCVLVDRSSDHWADGHFFSDIETHDLRWFMRHIWGMSQRMLPSPFKMVHFSVKLMAFNAQVETHHDTVYIHIYTYNIIQLLHLLAIFCNFVPKENSGCSRCITFPEGLVTQWLFWLCWVVRNSGCWMLANISLRSKRRPQTRIKWIKLLFSIENTIYKSTIRAFFIATGD